MLLVISIGHEHWTNKSQKLVSRHGRAKRRKDAREQRRLLHALAQALDKVDSSPLLSVPGQLRDGV